MLFLNLYVHMVSVENMAFSFEDFNQTYIGDQFALHLSPPPIKLTATIQLKYC